MAWQIASLTSLIVSSTMAVHFGGRLAPYLSAEEPWNRFVAMLVLYLLTSLAIWLAFRVVAKAISRVQLKDFDRQAGALFGAAKGVLWCLVITFFAVTLSESARQAIPSHPLGLLHDVADSQRGAGFAPGGPQRGRRLHGRTEPQTRYKRAIPTARPRADWIHKTGWPKRQISWAAFVLHGPDGEPCRRRRFAVRLPAGSPSLSVGWWSGRTAVDRSVPEGIDVSEVVGSWPLRTGGGWYRLGKAATNQCESSRCKEAIRKR